MKELPEKIILDYSCVKTYTQEILHKLLNEHFPFIQDTSSKQIKGVKKASHLESNFFHKRLCNDPSLLTDDNGFMRQIKERVDMKEFKSQLSKAHSMDGDESKSGKVRSFMTLLEELEIEESPTSDTDSHRALVFFQHWNYLSIIEQIVRKLKIPYLVLKSEQTNQERFEVAERFNKDEKFRLLLLTT